METVYEEPTQAPAPASLPNTKSFTTWVKELTSTTVKNMSGIPIYFIYLYFCYLYN